MVHCRNRSENFSNWSSPSNISLESTSLLMEIVKPAIYAMCELFGIIGNVLVIITLIRLRGKITRVTDFYLINLAIADLGSLLLVFPIVATRERLPMNWPFGEFVCLYLQPFTEVFHGASVWCIVITAMDRYLKIAKHATSEHVKQQSSLKKARIVAACTWLASFLIFSLPLYFVLSYRELPSGGTFCGPKWPAWDHNFVLARVYVAFIVLLSYILPVSVISWTFLAVCKRLNESNNFLTTMEHETDNETALNHNRSFRKRANRLLQNRRAKRILTPVVLVFAFSMLPVALLRLCAVFWPPIAAKTFYNTLFFVVILCAIINSSANPVIYTLVRRDIRRHLAGIVCGNRKHKSRRSARSVRRFQSIRLGLYRFPPSWMETVMRWQDRLCTWDSQAFYIRLLKLHRFIASSRFKGTCIILLDRLNAGLP